MLPPLTPPSNSPQRGERVFEANSPQRGERVHTAVPAGVRAKARRVLESRPLFLDYETTGLRKSIQVTEAEVDGRLTYPTTGTGAYHQVVEISVIDGNGRPVFHSWVNPERAVPAEIAATHGLAGEDLAGAPTWAEAAPLLRRALAGRVVVAHNAAFEALFTPPTWGVEWVCTQALADEAFGKYDWMAARADWRLSGSLANRLRQCGLAAGPGHTAAGDNMSVLRLLRFLAGVGQL